MAILWDFIFSKGKDEEEYINFPINKPIPIRVNTTDAWNEVKQKFAPPENPGVIVRDWIKEALDKFVEIKLARRLDEKGNNYEVFFRKRGKTKKSTRNFLLDLIYGEDEIVDEGQIRIDSYEHET